MAALRDVALCVVGVALIAVVAIVAWAFLRIAVRVSTRGLLERRSLEADAATMPPLELERRVNTISRLVLRIGGALQHPELLEPRDEPRGRGPLHALAGGELGRRQRAVGVDRGERRGERRAEPLARLLAQASRGPRDRETKPDGEIEGGCGTHS